MGRAGRSKAPSRESGTGRKVGDTRSMRIGEADGLGGGRFVAGGMG